MSTPVFREGLERVGDATLEGFGDGGDDRAGTGRAKPLGPSAADRQGQQDGAQRAVELVVVGQGRRELGTKRRGCRSLRPNGGRGMDFPGDGDEVVAPAGERGTFEAEAVDSAYRPVPAVIDDFDFPGCLAHAGAEGFE